MPSVCCIPKCNSNASNSKEYVQCFQFPRDRELRAKWLANIPRKDFTPSSYNTVCAKHFEPHLVQKGFSYMSQHYGREITVPGKRAMLVPGAVPTIFPDATPPIVTRHYEERSESTNSTLPLPPDYFDLNEDSQNSGSNSAVEFAREHGFVEEGTVSSTCRVRGQILNPPKMSVSSETDIRNISKHFIIEFLQLYKSFTCLWKIKSVEYSNRSLKHYAYEVLVDKFREVDSEACRDTVVKKIDSMRGSFRKEYKKYLLSTQSGVPEDVYRPKLWYYNHLAFLKDQEVPLRIDMKRGRGIVKIAAPNAEEARRQSFESVTIKEEAETEYDEFYSDPAVSVCSDNQMEYSLPLQPVAELASTSSAHYSPDDKEFKFLDRLTKRRKPNEESSFDDTDQLDNKDLVEPMMRREDDFDVIGKNVANKLRRMPRDVRIITEKLMMDVLFQAELGYVNRHTTITMNNITMLEDDDDDSNKDHVDILG